jgi:hypothetical protein
MENSRIAGAKRRLVVAKRLTAAVAAVAFGATFVAIRSGGAATPNTAPTSTTVDAESTPSSQQSFFGNSSVGSSSGAAPSVSSSTS